MKLLKAVMKYIIIKLMDLIVFILIGILQLSSFLKMSQFISLIPFSFGNILRNRFYYKTLKLCGENCNFHFGTIITYRDIIIGNNVSIGPYNTLGYVELGDNVITAQFVHILSGNMQHGYERNDVPIIKQKGILRTVHIGSDVWIGANSVIMNDVSNGCIIGAGAVVTKPTKEYTIVAGNPGKCIKDRMLSGTAKN